ncbi:hypothetical protein HL666_06365 [Bradyrhizobium sp. 83002]|uniref:hypothetical protein n=1 Tax=Bradyrhizobium aeschynomenes TaxID=2734909 RepID=UPI001557EBFA|nr:hypothetical protein [Bradyrhizobium aeschynomenes]NPU10373.1 hypothetical protein [Bradyrhizobium aeschynomenes]NPV19689.1 hypothetical protein [Bradyrhizobium aeschynomenes]
MSRLTDKTQGHQNPGQNQQGQTQGKPIRQGPGESRQPGQKETDAQGESGSDGSSGP